MVYVKKSQSKVEVGFYGSDCIISGSYFEGADKVAVPLPEALKRCITDERWGEFVDKARGIAEKARSENKLERKDMLKVRRAWARSTAQKKLIYDSVPMLLKTYFGGHATTIHRMLRERSLVIVVDVPKVLAWAWDKGAAAEPDAPILPVDAKSGRSLSPPPLPPCERSQSPPPLPPRARSLTPPPLPPRAMSSPPAAVAA